VRAGEDDGAGAEQGCRHSAWHERPPHPLRHFIAWIALSYASPLGADERVVVHAASSGVGASALRIARWKSADVIAISEAGKAGGGA
jgi:hypothetical protein